MRVLMAIALWMLCWLPVQAGTVLPDSDATVRLEHTSIRETLPGQSISSAYFVIVNPYKYNLELVGASSPQSPRVEIHEHRHDNGMMQMRKLESVTVPAQGRLVFESGGLHLMLMDLPQPLRVGENVSLTLHFSAGETGAPLSIEAMVPVKNIRDTLQRPDDGHAHHMH